MNGYVILFLGFMFLSPVLAAQSFEKAKLDQYFDILQEKDKFMGSVAVSKNGELIYSKSIGYANVEERQKADVNTKYLIGSISKTFTAVLVMKAVEENKLSLQQSISKYFPSIANAEKITIQNLLNHHSGIHNFTDLPNYLSWHTHPKTEKEMVQIINDGGSDFEPGTKGEYSNSNYVLLSYILEKVYKKPYAEILQEKIIEPLKLKNTYFAGKLDSKKNESLSYSFADSWKLEAQTDMSISLGAGGLLSTPIDLTRFSDALFGGKLISDNSLKQMEHIEDGYGMGLFQVPFYDMKGYGHTGGIDGFTSVLFYFPEGKVSYALTSNGTVYDNNNISIAVLSAIYGKPYDLPEISNYHVTSADLDVYLGTYASEAIPIKITITKEGNTLIAQGSGQPAFPLDAVKKNVFQFERVGVVIEFIPENQSMILKQGGGEFLFVKEKE